MIKKRTFHPTYDLTATELCAITGVDRRTARAWINGTQGTHPGFQRLIELELERRIIPRGAGITVTANKRGILVEIGQYVYEFSELNSLWLTLQNVGHNKMLVKEYEQRLIDIRQSIDEALSLK